MLFDFSGMCLGVVRNYGIKDPTKVFYKVDLHQKGYGSITLPISEENAVKFLHDNNNDVEYRPCVCQIGFEPSRSFNQLYIESIVLGE